MKYEMVRWLDCWNGGGAMFDGSIVTWRHGYYSSLAIEQDSNRTIEQSNSSHPER